MKIKQIIKYVLIFFITLFICVLAMSITSKIPKQNIKKQMQETAEFYKTVDGVDRRVRWREYSYVYYSMDSVLLNIIYCIDTDKPLSSSLNAEYYQRKKLDINDDFIELVEQDKNPNTEYLRYWHGSMVVLRPLLTVFSIQEIYTINTIIMWVLIIILTVMLFKKSKKLAITFIIGLISIMVFYCSSCLEYIWTTLIMLITSIIAISIEKDIPKKLGPLFLITGMLTCFFDFLTTETLTILMPLLLVLIIRYEDQRLTNIKDGIKFIINSLMLWAIGYFGMWISKWIIASIVLKINALDFVTEKAMVRVNEGVTGLTGIDLSLQAVLKNIKNLFPIPNMKKMESITLKMIPIGIILFELVVIDKKKIKKMWFSILLLIIGIMPYIRFFILANHSYRHSFFTFRAQLVSVVAIIYILINSIGARKKWIKV